jgi:nucleoside-triphosphatase
MDGQAVFIISGKQGGGKTTTLTKVINLLKKEGVKINGFSALGEWENGLRTAFFLEDIQSGTKKLLCKNKEEDGFEKHGRFYFNPATIAFGRQLLLKAAPGNLLVIDEIGRFELNGKVWSVLLKELVEKPGHRLMITVRDEFVEAVTRHFGFINPVVFQANDKAELIAECIRSKLKTA